MAGNFTITIQADKWADMMKERINRAKRMDLEEFRGEALDILKETALQKIQHYYVGNQVGGYYEGLDCQIIPNGLELSANSEDAAFVEFGSPPHGSRGGSVMVFRGATPSRYSEASLAKVFDMKPEIAAKKMKKGAIRLNYLAKRRKDIRESRKNHEGTHADLMAAVRRADKNIEPPDAEEYQDTSRGQRINIENPKARYSAARAMMRKQNETVRQYRYGIYTVFAQFVKGYKGKGVLKTSAARIATRLREYVKKQVVVKVTGKGGQYSVSEEQTGSQYSIDIE